MNITIGTTVTTMDAPTTALDCLRRCGQATPGVLAVMQDHQVAGLTATIDHDCTLTPLTVVSDEGRRIYERSLRFVMLLALHRLFPGQRVRIEYSVGQGVFVHLPGREVDDNTLSALQQEMEQITAADEPFVPETWTTEEAIAYFHAAGQQDKVALLKLRPLPTITMYRCGGMAEYFYGVMTPSTGYVKVFGLSLYQDGFVLRLPMADQPDTPSPYVDRPKHLSVFHQSAAWCRILGLENVSDLQRLMDEGQMRFFIRVNEALHDQAIGDIAREVVERQRRIVLVAGPSSSGKTTFAGRLAVHLKVLGRTAYRLSLDDYYLNRDDIPKENDGSIDLEALHALDTALLRTHLGQLIQGEMIHVPQYDFKAGKRSTNSTPLQLGEGDVVVIEGIHGLNPALCEGLPMEQIHRVFVSALTCINLDDHNRIRTTDVRLLRRIVRDYQFRGTTPETTLRMWPSVRRGEEKWIFPYQEQADSMFNTALHYELTALKTYAAPLLEALPHQTPGYALCSRLKKMLNYVPALPAPMQGEIPPLSLLREFIGGCTIDEV